MYNLVSVTSWYNLGRSGHQSGAIWYNFVQSGTIWYILVHSGTFRVTLATNLLRNPVHSAAPDTSSEQSGTIPYIRVQSGTFWYILVHFGTIWELLDASGRTRRLRRRPRRRQAHAGPRPRRRQAHARHTPGTRRHMLEAKMLIFHWFFNKKRSGVQANMGCLPPLGP